MAMNTHNGKPGASPASKKKKTARRRMLNIGFLLLCMALLVFLYLAPEETTSPLPRDEIHLAFHAIKSKKEADAHCVSCHAEDGEVPLPADHPDPYRCLFCHKRS